MNYIKKPIKTEKISIKEEMAIFEELMQKKKLKTTPQRIELAEWVFQVHDHFTVDDMVYSFAQKNIKISIATAYRFLQMMQDLSLLIEHDFGTGQKYYEHTPNHPHHEHIVCNDCNKIIEFSNQTLENLKEEITKKHGFKMVSHSLVIKGNCTRENCQNKNNT